MSITSDLTFSPPSIEGHGDVKSQGIVLPEDQLADSNSDIVSGNEAADNSEMSAEQNGMMTSSVSDSQHPEAHLEALDTIITCTNLHQTSSGEGQASIAALLRQAKSLLLDNTVTVILATLRELHREEEESSSSPRLPSFWSQVYSPQELRSWLQLLDMILYCWGSQSGEAPAFVEKYVRSYTEEIRLLRQRHDFEMSDLVDGGEGSVGRVQERLRVVKAALRPAHWTLVTAMKKLNRNKMKDLWQVLTTCLQMCGCLDLPSDSARSDQNMVPLDEMKTALSKLTFANLDRLTDFEEISKNEDILRRLRNEWLPSSHFDESKLRSIDLTGMANPAWHNVPTMAADFVAYLRAIEELARLRDRLSMRKETTIRETIYMRLLTMAAGQFNTIRRHQQWQKVPKVLKEAIVSRRQEMTARFAVSGGIVNLESPTNSTASSAASTSLSFSVDLESSVPITWNLSFVKNPMANIL